MQKRTYTEAELRSNRASVLLYGGTESDRQSWAQNVAENSPEQGPFVMVRDLLHLTAALARTDGVVYVEDIAALGRTGQMAVLNCLQHHEERPKFVLGMSASPGELVDSGLLRDDLVYRLSISQVNLSHSDTLAMLRNRLERRAAMAARAAVAQKVRAAKASAKAAVRAARR